MKKKILVFFLLTAVLLSLFGCSFRQEEVEPDTKETEDGILSDEEIRSFVVRVKATNLMITSEGSAFFVGNGYFITNSHVVNGFTSFTCFTWEGQSFYASLVGEDEVTDLAVIYAPDWRDKTGIPLTDSADISVGSGVHIVGYPSTKEGQYTRFDGEIRALSESVFMMHDADSGTDYTLDVIVTTAQAESGVSGGPALDKNNRLVGVISRQSTVEPYDSYVIPLSDVCRVCVPMMEQHKVSLSDETQLHFANIKRRAIGKH